MVVVAASMGACQSYAPPRLAIRDVTVAEQSPQATVLTFHVRGENPNDIDLKLRDVVYRFEPSGGGEGGDASGVVPFEALRSAEATLPRNGAREFRIPVVLSSAGTPDGGAPGGGGVPTEVRYRLTGTVEYLLPGSIAEVLFDTGLRRPTAAFSEEGRLDLSKIAPDARRSAAE